MKALPETQRPKSDDPDFWFVWSGKGYTGEAVERAVDWKLIADEGQQIDVSAETRILENANE